MTRGPDPHEEFVSEAITPVAGTFDAAAMSRGEAGLPRQFTWRGKTYDVARLIAAWKSSGSDAGEVYLRRHWFTVETTTGQTMTLYCERQTRNRKRPKARWWLYTIGS